jgi:lipoprotein NlpI
LAAWAPNAQPIHFFELQPWSQQQHRAPDMSFSSTNRRFFPWWSEVVNILVGAAGVWCLPARLPAQPPLQTPVPSTAQPAAARPSTTPTAGTQASGRTPAPPSLETADELSRKLALADRAGDGQSLLKIANDWIDRDPSAAEAYYWRGREHFRRGEVAQSVRDFDRYVELRPEREPPQWERGIALYYGRQFARGSKQFELYQTYDNRDVENSVWRYLCLARAENREKARATMLPVDRDPRVPMTEIFQLFAGKATPEQVLAAARSNDPPADVLAGRLFYAHLYLALFYESENQPDRCRQYLELAADTQLRRNPRINAYMWAVADVHWKLLKSNGADKKASTGEPHDTPRKPAKP